MSGIRALRRIQIGSEGTAGTATAATALWRGIGTLEDQREIVFPQEDVGYISGLDRSYVPRLAGAISFEDVPATFEQLPYIFEAGIKTVAAERDGTSGSGYAYTYAFGTSAKTTIKTYTIEGGDDNGAEEMAYSFVSDFKLSGKAGEAVMVGASWMGRQVGTSTFTGSIAVPTVEEILFSTGKLYLDAVTGTQGTTLKSNTFLGMDVSVKTGWIPVFAADGSLYFSFAKATPPEILLDITFEHDATALAEIQNFRNQTARLGRIRFSGNALGTTGTYTTKIVDLDFCGKWSKFSKIGEANGNDLVTGSMKCAYNSTAGKHVTFMVVSELSALP